MSNRFEECTNIKEVLGQALGAASVCWENPDKAGTFKSENCEQILNEAMEQIDHLLWTTDVPDDNPRVPYAREKALELASRLNLMDQGTDLIIQRAEAFEKFLIGKSTGNLSSSQGT